MNWNKTTVIKAGFIIGTKILYSTWKELQPSMIAASSNSRGMPRMNWTSMKTKKASWANTVGKINGT